MKEKSSIIVIAANFEKHTDYENHIASVHEGKKTNIENQIKKAAK